jgi:hypothetical protein
MSARIEVPAALWRPIAEHLRQPGPEQVAFVFADVERGNGLTTFVGRDSYLASTGDFLIQTKYHVTLTDDALAALIKHAWDSRMSIVELHTHPDWEGDVAFSPSDKAGLKDLVPYITWRLKGRPYAAIVIGPDTIDALAWVDNPEEPMPVRVATLGEEERVPTNLTYTTWSTADEAL